LAREVPITGMARSLRGKVAFPALRRIAHPPPGETEVPGEIVRQKLASHILERRSLEKWAAKTREHPVHRSWCVI